MAQNDHCYNQKTFKVSLQMIAELFESNTVLQRRLQAKDVLERKKDALLDSYLFNSEVHLNSYLKQAMNVTPVMNVPLSFNTRKNQRIFVAYFSIAIKMH